jgi:hypothetical protein
MICQGGIGEYIENNMRQTYLKSLKKWCRHTTDKKAVMYGGWDELRHHHTRDGFTSPTSLQRTRRERFFRLLI